MLASGDYSAASDIKTTYASELLATADPVTPTSTGDGYRMAFEIGASMVNGDIMRGPIMRFVPAPRGNLIQRLPPVTAVGSSDRMGDESSAAVGPETIPDDVRNDRSGTFTRGVQAGRNTGQSTRTAIHG